ncbi:hypothetical protein H8B09_12990 [Paenibacillus sp. PR3]|uniref:Uncharacterized protein n=1 Tax=Paenibacillus terricola TaxID=2763503 RepID=A0ABR8MUM4_9BACL|nr:hypothetical protein [Paenibacillus terricola]MBD3919673.1 hypothetical protein [Paenibacillus terricola]
MYFPLRQLFLRKIISAAIATFLFTLTYAWLEPNPFSSESIHSIGARSHEAFRIINVYMIYAAPAIYLYGVATSLISELIASTVTQRLWLRLTVSTIFHCGFGLILLHISLIAAFFFLIADTIISLKWKKTFSMNLTLASTLLPISLWLLSVAYINMTG